MPWLYITFALTLLSLTEGTNISLGCEDGWTLITPSKRCYKYFDLRLPWIEARGTCMSYSAVLAEPVGYDVNAELGKLIANVSSMAWIGYNYVPEQANESNIDVGYWSDWSPESIAVALWDINQPSLKFGRCTYTTNQTTNDDWKWRLTPCEDMKPFLCQRTACLQDTFNCRISGKHSACLNKSKVCNGVPDCLNGFDESNCPERNRFYNREDAGKINPINTHNENNPVENGIIYQWTIEGRLGSQLQLSLNVTDGLNDLSVLEIWLEGRTLQDSYLYGTYTEPLKVPEIITSSNNFAIIRFTAKEHVSQDMLNITWSSDPHCYWKSVPYRPAADANYFTEKVLPPNTDINSCFEDCHTDCHVVTLDKFENTCYLYDLTPLHLTSSCCESYVKICPEKPSHLEELEVKSVPKMLHSASYPFEYSDNMHYSWILKAPRWDIITLEFMDIDIDPQSSITVYNGKDSTYGILAKFVSGSMPTIVFSSGNTLAVHFRTGPRPGTRKGFFAGYKTGCNVNAYTNFIQLQSPAYDMPVSYLPLLDCVWTITIDTYPPAMSVKFDSKFGLKMNQDFLKVYNGTMDDDHVQFTGNGFTGDIAPPNMQTFSKRFNLRFVTNSIVPGVGFRVTFSAIKYCGALPDLRYGYWESVSGFYSGHNATYKCLENYEYAAEDTVHCTDEGIWKPLPICKIKTCPPIFNLANGEWVKINESYRAECHTYRHVIGDPLVVCWNGTWQGNPTCEKIPCKYFFVPKFAERITPENVTYYLGDTLQLTCSEGFRLKGVNPFKCDIDRTPICEDIDECAENTSNCEQICVNTPSHFECDCYKGYEKNNITGKENTCVDINECNTNNGGCDHICTNFDGYYQCSCFSGYELFHTNGLHNSFVHQKDTGYDPGDYLRYNHSCVRITCHIPSINDTILFTPKTVFYFNDSVEVGCNQAYQLVGNSTITCLENGNWSTLPICKKATCPPVISNTGVVKPPGELNYGDSVSITCTLNGSVTTALRHCLWDTETKRFTTLGGPIDCPVIDCGKPMRIGGAAPYEYNCTTYGCSFNFSCLPEFTIIGKTEHTDEVTVECSIEGRWAVGSIGCKGASCQDPGTPAEARQSPASFDLGTEISLLCSRQGYTITENSIIKCIYKNGNLVWDKPISQCVDIGPPEIANCTQPPMYVSSMEEVTLPLPNVTDNSGAPIDLKVRPFKFRFPTIIATDATVTYEASDWLNNTETCYLKIIIKDSEKPKVSCPNVTTFLLYETVKLTGEDFTVNASDNSGEVTLIYEPSELVIGQEPNAAYVIKVTAKDPSDNKAICYIQVKTEDVPGTKCDKRRLDIPNSDITCPRSDYCDVTCKDDYLFFDQPALVTRGLQCDPSKGWPMEGIYCLPKEKEAFHISLFYTYATTDASCVQSDIIPKAEVLYTTFSDYLDGIYNFDVKIIKPTIGFLGPFSTKSSGNEVVLTMTLELVSPQSPASRMISVANDTVIPLYGTAEANKFSSTCGSTTNVTSSAGFVCSGVSQVFIINDRAMCVACPPGTYGMENKCIPCPENTYNSLNSQRECTDCSDGTYTNKKGSKSINSCYDKCPPGFYSENGLIPCMPCPDQTYSYNTTLCKSCPAGNKTDGTVATSEEDCQKECQPGTYSDTGFIPCTPCPKNSYAEFNGAKMCDLCAETHYLDTTGSSNRADCQISGVCNGAVCQNGGTCYPIHKNFYCDCPQVYTGVHCETPINPCLSNPCFNNQPCTPTLGSFNYTCNCGSGFTGKQCEIPRDHCEQSTICQHSGICKNKADSYSCVCPLWDKYEGASCNNIRNPCNNIQCQNSGECINLSVRSYCKCPTGFTGKFCERRINHCESSPCLNSGTCINGGTTFDCQCPSGFTGTYCQFISTPCSSMPCDIDLICFNDFFNTKSRCECPGSYVKSPDTQSCVLKDYCKDSCKNGGICGNKFLSNGCNCPTGYKGSRCHIKQCTNNSCPGGEECKTVGNYDLCVCKKPLIGGVRCVEDVDFCKEFPCNPNGTYNCTNLQNDYSCNCLEGFSGRHCEVTPCSPGCLHGNCTMKLGSWVCECEEEWTGKNCTELITLCDANPCQNQGKCVGNLVDFNCICQVGYRNKTCNQVMNPCEPLNPCVGASNVCKNLFTRTECACSNGQLGYDCDGIPACLPKTCQNGGTCVFKNFKENCICPIGFGGKTCNTTIDPCSNIVGCNQTYCENQGQQVFCKCMSGKIGQHCNQDVLYDVDLNFPRSKGFIQPTPIPMWSPLTRNFLTLAFWIKYYLPIQKDGLTTSLVLYGTNNFDGNSPISELLSLDNNSLTIQFSEMKTFNLTIVNDGWWHYVFITWFNNVISIYLDFNLITSEPYGKDKTLPMYGVLIPGGIINITRHAVTPSKFAGRINRLVLLNSTWSAEEVNNIRNNVNQVLRDVIVDFYRSVLDMANILLEFPTEIRQNMCELDPSCSENKTGQFPVVDICPPAQLNVGTSWSNIDWVQPKFSHNSTTVSNYVPGVSYFEWNTYTIEYIAFGKNNETSAVCTFQLFSRRFRCNETISSFYLNHTDKYCQQHNESIICSPNCNGANKILLMPSPMIYSCGVAQMWGKKYTPHFRFLPCETATPAKTINLKIEMTMETDGVQPLLSVLCGEIKEKLEALMATHEICPKANCSSCSENPDQSARKKRAVSSTALQVNLQNINSNSMNGSLSKDLLLKEISERNLLNLQGLNTSILASSVTITASCNAGQQLNGQICVVIQPVPGTFLSATSNIIEVCPKGTYQPNSGQTSCINCPTGYTTMGILSTSIDECSVICRAGSQFDLKANSCLPCDIGFYQSENASFLCDACRDGKVTLQQGSKSPNECVIRAFPLAVAGLGPRDIAIVVVVCLLAIFFLLCILLFCYRAKIKKFCPCLSNNKVEDTPKPNSRYSATNVKMVSYNLTNIRERRMGKNNDIRSYPPRNESPDFFLESNSDVSSSLEGRQRF